MAWPGRAPLQDPYGTLMGHLRDRWKLFGEGTGGRGGNNFVVVVIVVIIIIIVIVN